MPLTLLRTSLHLNGARGWGANKARLSIQPGVWGSQHQGLCHGHSLFQEPQIWECSILGNVRNGQSDRSKSKASGHDLVVPRLGGRLCPTVSEGPWRNSLGVCRYLSSTPRSFPRGPARLQVGMVNVPPR